MTRKIIFLLIFSIISLTVIHSNELVSRWDQKNQCLSKICTAASVGDSMTDAPLLTTHQRRRLAPLWLLQSGVGLVGSGLNTFILFIFYQERTSLLPSVNTMRA